jgi:hypothetical protein
MSHNIFTTISKNKAEKIQELFAIRQQMDLNNNRAAAIQEYVSKAKAGEAKAKAKANVKEANASKDKLLTTVVRNLTESGLAIDEISKLIDTDKETILNIRESLKSEN